MDAWRHLGEQPHWLFYWLVPLNNSLWWEKVMQACTVLWNKKKVKMNRHAVMLYVTQPASYQVSNSTFEDISLLIYFLDFESAGFPNVKLFLLFPSFPGHNATGDFLIAEYLAMSCLKSVLHGPSAVRQKPTFSCLWPSLSSTLCTKWNTVLC